MPKFKSAVVYESTVTLAADPASALQAATKQYVDASGALGHIASVVRATNNTGISTFTLIDSLTFTAVAGRRYKVTWDGGYNNSDALFQFRWIAGASITATGGTLFAAKDNSSAGTNITFTMIKNITTLTPGQVTIGAVADGASLVVLGDNNFSRIFMVEDIGT